MNKRDILLSVLDDVECRLRHHQQIQPASLPETVSPWLASAVLQKAIRRGQTALALAAANVLLRASPSRLWRRLSVIVVEDVGIGSLDTLYLTIAAMTHRQRLAHRFGAPRLASFIVSGLASAIKCRGADDLHVATEHCSAWTQDRLEFAEMPLRDLLGVIAGNGAAERRAIAVRYAIGTEWRSTSSPLAARRGNPQAVFDLLCEIAAHTLVEVSREAYRQTGEPFCAFLPLLHQSFVGSEPEVRRDLFPPETTVMGLPSWCLDGFSREGRRALAYFVKSECPSARWLRAHLAPGDRMEVIHRAQFQVEAGLVTQRLIWPTAERLRKQADFESWPFSPAEAAQLLTTLRSDIGVLNDAREATYAR